MMNQYALFKTALIASLSACLFSSFAMSADLICQGEWDDPTGAMTLPGQTPPPPTSSASHKVTLMVPDIGSRQARIDALIETTTVIARGEQVITLDQFSLKQDSDVQFVNRHSPALGGHEEGQDAHPDGGVLPLVRSMNLRFG